MDIIGSAIDQQQPQNDQDIVEENIHAKNEKSQNNLEIIDEAIPQAEAMISSQASTIKQETVEQSQIQNANAELKNEHQLENELKQDDQSDLKDTEPADTQRDQPAAEEQQQGNALEQVENPNKELNISNQKCSIHDIKNKYICIQSNCSAASRIACAECHVEGPHPKHDMVKIESFKEEVQQKSKRTIELFQQINKESAKKQICDLIQKVQDDFLSQLNEFKEEKMKLIEGANLIGDEILQNEGENSSINYGEILPLFANQEIQFQDTSLLKLALVLYNSEQNDSVEVQKANFQLFIEDIQKDISHIEKNLQRAFIQRISSEQDIIIGVDKEPMIKQNKSEGVRNVNTNVIERQQEQEQSLSQIELNSQQIMEKEKKAALIHKRNPSSLSSKEPYNWRERRDQQRLEDEKLMNQEGSSTLMRKTLQLKIKGQCIKKLLEHKGWVGRIERVGDNIFASCSSDKKVIFWDIITQKPIKTWIGEQSTKNHILSLCKLDSKTIAMGGSDKLIKVYEWETETMVKLLKGHKGGVNYIISLNDEVIASCGSDNSIVVWNWKQEVVLNHLANFHTQAIYQIASLHSNSFLASCSKDTTIKIYNFDKKETVTQLKGAKQAIHTICYLKKNLLAAGSADQTIRIWNYMQSIQTKVIKVPNQSIYTICRIDDHYIASGQSDNKIKIWAYEEGETLENSQDSRHGYGAICVKTLESHTSAVSSLNYFPEKFILISGSNDHSICLWQ